MIRLFNSFILAIFFVTITFLILLFSMCLYSSLPLSFFYLYSLSFFSLSLLFFLFHSFLVSSSLVSICFSYFLNLFLFRFLLSFITSNILILIYFFNIYFFNIIFSFLENMDKILQPNYLPSDDDILHSRIRTTGLYSRQFPFSLSPFLFASSFSSSLSPFSSSPSSPSSSYFDDVMVDVYDVGGAKQERKKWPHIYYPKCDSLFFVVSLIDYDQTLLEKFGVNRMLDSLSLFEDICNLECMDNILLFFNKEDVFKEKIEKVSIKSCFPEFDGRTNYTESMDFIINKFLECNKTQKKIHVHVGSAINSGDMENILNAAKMIALRARICKVSE